MPVRHAQDVLLDDRARVEGLGHVVAGRPDHLHATGSRGVVRPRSRKSGQESMVDVDDPVRVFGDEGRVHDLHVTGEDDEVDGVLPEEPALRLPDLVLVFLRKRERVEGTPKRPATGSRSAWLLTTTGISTSHSPDRLRARRS